METRGLREAFAQAQVGEAVYFVDELRLGLHGQVQARWGVRGVPFVQAVERVYRWRGWMLAVNPWTGAVRWAWVERLQGAALAEVVAAWQADGVGVGQGGGALVYYGEYLGKHTLPTAQDK